MSELGDAISVHGIHAYMCISTNVSARICIVWYLLIIENLCSDSLGRPNCTKVKQVTFTWQWMRQCRQKTAFRTYIWEPSKLWSVWIVVLTKNMLMKTM